ncbi:hypothetical protein HN51_000194 [Arachis hypogaea]|nr:S-adenosyl-L-methionine-dependent tRNA 4-demethylwyosine synthase [Arachis hypogaea]QHO47757.1 S-adenosyl-L-methionine-dependent tRNA 4-demethylwyosine synthase [Arachis hypogaea]QHO47758.1 S-adenosyl-L-methionine-dependent tRNA 4-demethylwyosine synthase [Arachis hypogaea]QHO47999.1 S-adenosyl-L-methionine-dependent tRNA 4-demethylwyosine synthase [Arachis hypogaea]
MAILSLSSSLEADISVPLLLSTVTVVSATATTLLLICKPRLMRLMRLYSHKKNLIRLHHEKPKSNPTAKILFVSQIGTSKALASCLCDLFESFSVVTELVDARDYVPEALPKENLVVLVASTSEVWNLGQDFISTDNRSVGAMMFAGRIVNYAKGYKFGSLVVNAYGFSAFVAGKGASGDDTNLMAKAANHIRDLGDTAELNGDFDSWWGSVVGVLQGAVSGGAADAMCGEYDPEDVGSSDPKLSMTQRLYLFVENINLKRDHVGPAITRRMLTITEANFIKNGTVDLEDGGHVTAKWPLRDGLLVDYPLPYMQGVCSVGHSFFFAGGNDLNIIDPELCLNWDDQHPSRMWCLKYEGSNWSWKFCGSMFCCRYRPLVVPYDGKLYIFGGTGTANCWVDIYSLKSGLWETREVPESALLSYCRNPDSYFLWEDSTKPHKKTHIVLYSCGDEGLMSYDVKANNWEYLDWNFPPVPEYCPRKLVRLGCSHYLLIVDFAPMWHIYDLSKMKVVETVEVDGLDKTAEVMYIFCCHNTSDESLIDMFMEPGNVFEGEPSTNTGSGVVSYARVKLQLKTFSAKIESKGNFNLGDYVNLYMFAVGDEDQ